MPAWTEQPGVPAGELLPEEEAALRQLEQLATTALVELGVAFLEQEDAEVKLQRAQGRLQRAKKIAHEADYQRSMVLAQIVTRLELSPGEWIFDAKLGKLVKKEPST